MKIVAYKGHGIRSTGVLVASHENNWETWNWRIIEIPGAGHENIWDT
jgi:hypothetical protein